MDVIKFPSSTRPELRTGSVFREPSGDDGLRLMIVQRSIVDLCVEKDPGLTWRPEESDGWIRALYPGEYQKRRVLKNDSNYAEFKENYRETLAHPMRRIFLEEIVETVLEKEITVTLLCVESDPRQCHRGITAGYAREIDSRVPIVIL